jgi:hypothetical protein
MTVHVIVNGRPWAVAIEPAGPAGLVTVTVNGSRVIDGLPHRADARRRN